MKLIDRDLVELAAQYGNQDTIPDPVVIARYICTTSPAIWLVTWFDHVSGYASGYRSGQGNDDGWGLFNILELARMLIPTDTFFFDHKSGGTVHRQSYGRVIRDAQFTPRRLSDCIPLRERLLGVPELKARKDELGKKPVIMKPEPAETPDAPVDIQSA
jgi:hypothetical protein